MCINHLCKSKADWGKKKGFAKNKGKETIKTEEKATLEKTKLKEESKENKKKANK